MKAQSSWLIIRLLPFSSFVLVQYIGKEIVSSIVNDKWVIAANKSNCTTPKSCVIDAKHHQFDLLETLSEGSNMFGHALAISER
jgi:hypothetical protein